MSLLQVQDIHTYRGDSYVLQGVSLKVEEGQTVAVLGRNGVGKTTLVRSIMGFDPPRRGKVIYQGENISHLDPFRICRGGISLVPQGRRIFGSLTTKENMQIAAQRRAISRWSLEEVLSMFPPLKQRLHTRGENLSGGEQQMLAFGRALMGNATLFLMDEPSEGLSPLLVESLKQVIITIKEQGSSILLVEQNLPLAFDVADYVYVMSKGIIVYESEPSHLQDNAEIKSRYLGV